MASMLVANMDAMKVVTTVYHYIIAKLNINHTIYTSR
jgi:hypothetical protein